MENFQQWDYCKFQNEDCIIYDIDDNSLTLAFWESSHSKVPLHSISSSLLDKLKFERRKQTEGNALLELCQPKIMSLSNRRHVPLYPSQKLLCLHDNKVYNFNGLFSKVHANENGHSSNDYNYEEFLSINAKIKDTNGIRKNIKLDDLISHFYANPTNRRDSSTLRSMRLTSLKM
tara:strand:+ start:54 stop:578 length:525 start_codon:yes stop_codon:yes gene_type:complete